MTLLSLDWANKLEQLGLTIFNPNINLTAGTSGPATYISGPDPNLDAQLAALIADPMLEIDGRTLATGFQYSLNVTNALQLRPKHWYLHGLMEYDSVTSIYPVNCELSYIPLTPPGVQSGVNSFGMTLGLATCAAICQAWACIVRMWLMKNYPDAVTQYTGLVADPAVVGTAATATSYTQNPPA